MSGGSDNAANAAEQQQQQQQEAIAAGTSQVQSIFQNPARTAQYQQLATDTTNYYTQQLNQQQQVASRNLKFSLADNGQTGGSVQADQTQQLGQDYDTGLLSAQREGNQAGAALQASDTQEEANLIGAVQGGESTAQAATQASEAMQSNLSGAQASAESSSLGQAFGDFSTIYQNTQTQAAARQGQLYGYGAVYSPIGSAPTSMFGG